MERRCIYSPDKRHRYTLWRKVAEGDKYANFVCLNPSTATDEQDDPTIRRCKEFARKWGYGWMCVTNIFAYRATDPRIMKRQSDPIGPENNHYLAEIARGAGIVIAAWGTHGEFMDRDEEAILLLPDDLKCLGVTKEGYPRHPLYVKGDAEPFLY